MPSWSEQTDSLHYLQVIFKFKCTFLAGGVEKPRCSVMSLGCEIMISLKLEIPIRKLNYLKFNYCN